MHPKLFFLVNNMQHAGLNIGGDTVRTIAQPQHSRIFIIEAGYNKAHGGQYFPYDLTSFQSTCLSLHGKKHYKTKSHFKKKTFFFLDKLVLLNIHTKVQTQTKRICAN